MELLFVSFFAGMLTVLAPCILPLLPVIIGGSAVSSGNRSNKSIIHPLIITSSLAISILLFTLLLKVSTSLLGIPQEVWNILAGGIVLLLGINLVFPILWEKLMIQTNLVNKSSALLGSSFQKSGYSKDILIGASLGPVFSSCSPTYALIVATVLPRSFGEGLVYLVAYILGLSLILLLIAVFGNRLTQKLGVLSNPNGWFKKTVGILFIVVGFAVIFGLDKDLQSYILENGLYDPISNIEQSL